MFTAQSILIMSSVQRYLPLLQILQSAKPKLRKSILQNADAELISTLIECIYNTLNGNVILNKSETNKLKKFKNVLRKILNSKGRLSRKRQIIIQSGHGAFLPILLAPIVSAALTHFLGK